MSLWFDKSQNRWRVRIKRRGREVRRTLPAGISRGQAEEFHVTIQREFFDIAELGHRESHTIADAIERYMTEEVDKLKSNRTSDLKAIWPFCQGKRIEDMPLAVKEYREASPHLTAASRNRRAAALRRIATLSHRWGWLESPPYIPMEPETGHRETYLNDQQIKALANAACDEDVGAFVLLAAYTGARRSELCNLTPEDVSNGTIHIRHTKTGRPRVVPVARAALAALQAIPFAKHKDTYSKEVVKAASAAKLGYVRLHDLRHSTASLLLNAGVGLEIVGQILGHASTQTTRRYAHLSLDAARIAIGKIGGHVNAVAPRAPK